MIFLKELEVKILNINLGDIRNKVKTLNCKNVKKENQINKIFDFKNNTLLQKQGYARIRIVEDLILKSNRYYMTVKKLLSENTFKIMDEHEIEISNFQEGENIFKALGLNMTQCIKKYRESYKYKNSLIEIDINDKSFCPFPYIEIESPNEEELEEIVHLLGYSIKDTTSKNIYELIELFKNGKESLNRY
ncbi:adenylate cyclase [Clostridium tetani]|uniref:Adenylate cyclase n=1 Tax=Clostridium tetani TaxID=1513 RepID=A0A4Q0V4I9_CLOTA|nr:adenylate cyclase [Clostridium tetani]RXI48583.1 adenylate cyclase [Clostridium tetani]RXI58571.1 adenylate cyclase [Clostridium tetani]RXI73283.1 adenylate cyclase [Clostridium tetani]